MSEKWIEKEDCVIDRRSLKGSAYLVDLMGNGVVFIVPDTFTDEQIWECLRVANNAYGYGHTAGEKKKANEIVKSLGLK